VEQATTTTAALLIGVARVAMQAPAAVRATSNALL
jgi:hypothetical protein